MSRLSLRDFALVIALLVICGFFTMKVPDFGFVTPRNLSLLMIDFAITATLAVGMLLVILPGHIDLSAGSGVGLIGESRRCWWRIMPGLPAQRWWSGY
jgi:D-xylose transport system permease protein